MSASSFNVTAIPSQVGSQLGVDAFIGGLLISILLLMLVLIPTMIMTRGKAYSVYLVLALATLAPLTALGWFNVWVFIVIVLVIALGTGQKVAEFLGGLRK